MRFRDFLQEQKEKHAVMAFGRMNPITVGHEKLVNKVQDIAKEVGGSAHIVVSHSQDPKKNPLTAAQKVRHAKKAFPGVNISSSDKESPNFLSQASKLHQKGVTHLHMVGGSDRAAEYEHLLNKYNGVHGPHGFFKFKGITVHSAGDRDPDAEGVEGMSASKMREHATKGNFKEFRKGVPSRMTDSHAKAMYNDVRRGMGLHEDVDLDFVEVLVEGVHDQSIFKAVFLAGGPGSGKDYVLDNTLQGQGLTEINSDKALEFLMDKEGLDKKMPESEKEIRDYVRNKAKNMTELRQRLALKGRNGLIINGTGDNVEKVARIKTALEEMGYDTSMVLVNTDDDISAERNIDRGRRGGRAVPETIRKEKWDAVQDARTEYAKMFGDKYMEFDNSQDLREAPPEVVRDKKIELLQIYKNVKEFVSTPPQSEEASLWVAHELDVSDTSNIDPSKTVNPHPSSGAAEEAAKLGLQYYGFGRYGKNGTVTHRSVHDKLVEITRDEPQQKEMPIPGTSMHKLGDQTIHVKLNKKNINEEFDEEFEDELLSEAVSFTVTADTNEEMKQFLSTIIVQDEVREVDEEYEAKDLLSLGKIQQPFGTTMENSTITNQMVSQIMFENEDNYLKDSKGRVRIFMLRAAAAREAHQKEGKVVKYKHGYAILIKEETDNVIIIEETIGNSKTRTDTGSTLQSGTTGSEGSGSGTETFLKEDCSCETSSKKTSSKKITIAEIRNRKKKIESCGCDESKEIK